MIPVGPYDLIYHLLIDKVFPLLNRDYQPTKIFELSFIFIRRKFTCRSILQILDARLGPDS